MAFYAKCCQVSSTYKALHDPWCRFILGLWWVSLAEYLLVLRVYFPLVANGTVYHGYCKNCFSPAMDEEWDHGHGPSILVCSGCFCWTWSWNWHVSKLCVLDVLKLCCFCYRIWTSCCNNYIWTPMYVDYLWTLCNMWCVYVESCMILVVCVLYFESLRGTRRTTRFISAQVWECDCLGSCHCTCALINWTIIW